jgi:NTE family protein
MRVGIALGGGGAKGWAHIGVLRTLRDAGVTPEIVAGTSMGAIVGGAYAAGRLDALEDFARGMDRKAALALVDLATTGGGLILGERVANALRAVIGTHMIAGLTHRFAAVATELDTGHEIWLSEGDLVAAMRASYAMPGIIAPAHIDGRILVDGGITNQVPVSVCRALGAHVVIAVPLATSPSGGVSFKRVPKPDDATAWQKMLAAFREPERFIAGQLFGDKPGALTTASVSIAALNIILDRTARVRLASEPADVTVTPDITGIALLEFDRAADAIRVGAEAAKAALPDIEAASGDTHPSGPRSSNAPERRQGLASRARNARMK